ncbi:DUF4274 domain-containing protein [Methylosinus sp. H3A]|uniref:DUF4274 domain-containing protein n=1 Tax=Methylosinus sp. H3A TaxID=2785786 RepID=UPI0018C3081D|nr:DUF4274 domain-containing protein [Methylosinus sp. H3A]MBG0809672.1 DUF4274 domain-containing protein [Methylosinus sp. H3A]
MSLAVDDLLRRWVEERAASLEPGDGEYAQFIADWLPLASSDDWHRMILGHNRDLGDAPLFWIMRQARCEKATALGIFYLSRPGLLLAYGKDRATVPEPMKRAYDLIGEIRMRYVNGFYRASTLRFDAVEALAREARLPARFHQAALDLVIPPEMRVSIPGRKLGLQHGVRNHFRFDAPLGAR